MNTVNVDPANIEAGFEALAAEAAPPVPPVSADLQAAQSRADVAWTNWGPILSGLLPTVESALIPNWTVAPEHRELFARSFAEIAESLIPGGLEHLDKAGPYAKLAFACAMVYAANYGRPMKLPRPTEPGNAPADAYAHLRTHAGSDSN